MVAAAPPDPSDPDVVPVRPGEEIDVAKVAAYLDGRLPAASGALAIRQFPGGHANLTYLLSYPGAEYVLRRPPPGDLPASAHDMGREYRVLSVLHRAFAPAPRAFVLSVTTAARRTRTRCFNADGTPLAGRSSKVRVLRWWRRRRSRTASSRRR